MTDAMLVMTTVASQEQAHTIAQDLVEQELAVCVNILPIMHTFYRFKGEVHDDTENLLMIKTTKNLYDSVCASICQMHTYEIPEVFGIKMSECEPRFLDWITRNVREHPPEEDR